MKIAITILFVLTVFMGYTNINTTEAAQNLELDVSVQKSKAKYWEEKYKELIQSGTCLERMPKYEEVVSG